MDYNLETEMDGDYFRVRIEPQKNTDVGELAGRMERNGLEYAEADISGYPAEAELTDESIEIELDISQGDRPLQTHEITENIRGYFEDTDLSQDFIDQFSGGMKTSESHIYK